VLPAEVAIFAPPAVAALWRSFSETEQKIRTVLASFSWNPAA